MTYKAKIEYLFKKIQTTVSKDGLLMQIFCTQGNVRPVIENMIHKILAWNVQENNINKLSRANNHLLVTFKNGSKLLITGDDFNHRGRRNNVVIIDSNLDDIQIELAYATATMTPRVVEIFDMEDRSEKE